MESGNVVKILLGVAVVLAAIAAYWFFQEDAVPAPVGVVDIDYASVFLYPEKNGYSFAKPEMGGFLETTLDSQNRTVFVKYQNACTVPVDKSLINAVRITRLSNGSYNISCLYGPMFKKTDLRVKKENGEYYGQYGGWFLQCNEEAARLFDVGDPSNETVNNCLKEKSELVETFGGRKSGDVRDYYYLLFACREQPPSDEFYAFDQKGRERLCVKLLEGFGKKPKPGPVGILVDAERKEVYLPVRSK